MQKHWILVLTVLAVGCLTLRAADDKPKHTIKEVMGKAHHKETGILPKVRGGTATKEEKEELLGLYQELAKNKPPKGDAKSWKTKTDSLVTAAKSLTAGDAGADKKMNMAANCMACHQAHRGN